MKKIALLFRNVALISACVIFGYACKKEKTTEVPIGKVAKGTFYIDLFEEGEIEAVNSTSISSPTISWRYGNLKITEMVKDGEEVKANDTLIVFDQAEVQKGIVDAEGRLEISRSELERMTAQQQSDLEDLEANYEVAQISQEISKIRLEAAGYESTIKKREIQLNLERADISLDGAKEQIENRKKIQQEELKQKKLSIQQDISQLNEANETLKKLFVIAPSPGIAIISHNWSSGRKFQVGDQCWSGFPIIQLPDLSKLKATVRINEVDIAKITKGMKVEVKPDAFSDSLFAGTVVSIANLAVNKDNTKIKVFPVEIVLDQASSSLLPGLTVSCRILINKIENALYIPLEALFTEGEKNFAYKKTRSGYEKTEVQVGVRNTNHIIITEGLEEKDEIALSNPVVKEEKTGGTAKSNEK